MTQSESRNFLLFFRGCIGEDSEPVDDDDEDDSVHALTPNTGLEALFGVHCLRGVRLELELEPESVSPKLISEER